MRWIDALKQWNEQHGGKWVIPRKGTSEHSEVMKLMGSGQASGYVKLMYSKLKNKRKPKQFENRSKKTPAALKQGYKSSAKEFDIERVAQPSKSLLEWAASLGQRTKRSAEEVSALRAAAEAKRSGREGTKAAKRVLKAPTLSIEEPVAEPEAPKRKRGRPKKAAAAAAAPAAAFELPKPSSGYNPIKELTERADKLKKEAAAASQRGDAKAEAEAAFELLEVYKEMKNVSGIKQVERIIESKGFEKKKKTLGDVFFGMRKNFENKEYTSSDIPAFINLGYKQPKKGTKTVEPKKKSAESKKRGSGVAASRRGISNADMLRDALLLANELMPMVTDSKEMAELRNAYTKMLKLEGVESKTFQYLFDKYAPVIFELAEKYLPSDEDLPDEEDLLRR